MGGLALAGVSARVPAGASTTSLGYVVLAADFHVHGFPDGIPPWDTVREARRRRLDVIALTSHNSMAGWWLWTHSPVTPAGAADVLVLPGEELTSAGYHLALVGISSTIPWRQSLADASAAAQAQGAVAILAHPSGDTFRDRLTDEGLRSVDGVEVAHPQREISPDARRDFPKVYRRAQALHPGVAAIGSSDFHYFGPLGACRTYVFARERTADAVLEALRAGRTVACDGRGKVFGSAAFASAVADRCVDDQLTSPDVDTAASRAGTVLVWAGLAALVLLGPSRS
jgi:hypothetical protein